MVSTRFGKPLRRVNYDYLLDPPFIAKKEDPGRLTITCLIGPKVFDNAFCDLGASINIMSKVIYDKILGGPLSSACFLLQMVDQSTRNPEGKAKDILVKIQNSYIPTDFVILDMGHNEEVPLLLGRPFFNTTNAVIHVGSGHVNFHIQDQAIKCPFNRYNMDKHIKNRPMNQPHKGMKHVWQVNGSTSMSTSSGTDVPSSSKK